MKYLPAVLASFLMASMLIISKPIASLNVFVVTAIVLASATAVMTIIAGRSSFKNIDYRILSAMVFCGTVAPLVLFFFGLRITTVSHSAVLQNAEMIFTVVLALILFGEKLSRFGYVGVAAVVAGVFMAVGLVSSINIGDIMILGASLLYGLDNNLTRFVLRHGVNEARVLQIKFGFGSLILFVVILITHTQIQIPLLSIPSLILIGAFGWGISYWLFCKSLKGIQTIRTIMIMSSYVIISLILAFIFLGERITFGFWIGALMIVGGIYILERSKQRIILNP